MAIQKSVTYYDAEQNRQGMQHEDGIFVYKYTVTDPLRTTVRALFWHAWLHVQCM